MRSLLFGLAIALLGCSAPSSTGGASHVGVPNVKGVAAKIVEGARQQLEHPAGYTGEYYSISYPNGDIPATKGACVDVVIRALRQAGYDLQKLIHEDMKQHFGKYPRHGARPD